MAPSPFLLLFTFALALSVNAHSLILNIDGANGVSGQGFGVVQSTPRDGDDETDTTRIRGRRGGICGATENGVNDVALNMAAAANSGVPSADADGAITMTIHQVNGDGAGPFTCEVSADGTGTDFQDMQVTTQVPGRNGRSRAEAQNFPMVAQMPTGVTCTGGPDGNACLMRCTQRNGFGGCAAITNAAENNAEGNNATETGNATGGDSNDVANTNIDNTNNGDDNASGANNAEGNNATETDAASGPNANDNTNTGGTNNGNSKTAASPGSEDGNSGDAENTEAGNENENAITDDSTAGAGNTAGDGSGDAGAGGLDALGGAKDLLQGVAGGLLGRRSPVSGRMVRSRIARYVN